MLTRVLRNCFEDESHRTRIVAAVAPGAEACYTRSTRSTTWC